MSRFTGPVDAPNGPTGEIDVRAIGLALKRRRRFYLIPTLVAFVLVGVFVNVVTPQYTAQTQLLLENQETFFTRPDRTPIPAETAAQLDEAAVASQIQLIASPDIARRAIKDLGLRGDDEFDPLARGLGPIKRVMILLGLAHDPTRDPPDARIVTAFLKKLVVFSPPKTRVLTIEFTSRDPALAARAANKVAELYIEEQSAAKRAMAKGAAEALGSQITDLRDKLAKADAEREQYRSQSDLLAGSNNMTISGQQLADINSDLSKARSQQADAQAKASMIRQLLKNGQAADVAEVTNNDIVRRLWDQRAIVQGQLALESRTLLPGHPRVKALAAQLAQYDLGLKSAAKQAAMTLENEARIAGTRVANLETVLAQQKKVAGVSNTDEVHLRALERVAQGYKEQLESSTTKYEEAVARESSTATPADARVISQAVEPQDASYPKKLPFIIFGTLATFVFTVGLVVAGELLSGRAAAGGEVVAPAEPAMPRARPAERQAAFAFEFPDRRASAAPMWDEPSEVAPRRAASQRPRIDKDAKPAGRFDFLRRFGIGAEDEDVVFAPVPERSAPASVVADERHLDVATRRGTNIAGLLGAAAGYLKAFGRSAAESHRTTASPDLPKPSPSAATEDGVGWDIPLPVMKTRKVDVPKEDVAQPEMPAGQDRLAEKIVAAHVPGRGLHIVGSSLGDADIGVGTLIELARALADKGRSIIVDLNRTPANLVTLGKGDAVLGMHGLSELLAGTASFAEVIQRDHGTRLHFIPTGLQEADFRDFDLILDALSETYDFIVLVAPPFRQSDIAKVMAPYADFVVLTAGHDLDADARDAMEAELIAAGARDVLIVGASGDKAIQNVA